ncbi:hypothetical protein [Actinoplanes octamycinicus]|uniref:hypothetical protein n=1 Tax=Actinoplanes octamycinicus TaxID=135948 RepID=UPI0019416ED2|nr:hypothetical protein [Actinoplanes octamycinicus]
MRWVRSGRSVAVARAVQVARWGDAGGADHYGQDRRADGRAQQCQGEGQVGVRPQEVDFDAAVFCPMKSISTTHGNAAQRTANPAVPVRV